MPLQITGRFAQVRPPPHYLLVTEDTPPPRLPDDPGLVHLLPEDPRSVDILRLKESDFLAQHDDPDALRDTFLDAVDAYLAEIILTFDNMYMLGDLSSSRSTQISQLKARLLARRDELCKEMDNLRVLQALRTTEQTLRHQIDQKRQTVQLLREQRRRILEEMPEASFSDEELPSRICLNTDDYVGGYDDDKGE